MLLRYITVLELLRSLLLFFGVIRFLVLYKPSLSYKSVLSIFTKEPIIEDY